MRVVITLSADRDKLGTLELFDGDVRVYSCQCLGRSDNAVAASHGNPARDWRKPYGDTPVGEFIGLVENIPGGEYAQHSYGRPEADGQVRILALAEPPSSTKPLRTGIWIHGGELNMEYTWWDGLRPTFGCVRLRDEHKERLIELLVGPVDVSIVETA